MNDDNKFYGKYRAVVIQNQDPMRRGRLMVQCIDALSFMPSTWAEASLPWTGGPGVPMGFFVLPAIGAAVWVEFEQGDPEKPVWTGCRWGLQSEIPSLAQIPNPVSPTVAIQTMRQNMIMVSDMPPSPTPASGGIVLRSGVSFIVVNESGIYISNGAASIFITGPTITMNNGALTIT